MDKSIVSASVGDLLARMRSSRLSGSTTPAEEDSTKGKTERRAERKRHEELASSCASSCPSALQPEDEVTQAETGKKGKRGSTRASKASPPPL